MQKIIRNFDAAGFRELREWCGDGKRTRLQPGLPHATDRRSYTASRILWNSQVQSGQLWCILWFFRRWSNLNFSEQNIQGRTLWTMELVTSGCLSVVGTACRRNAPMTCESSSIVRRDGTMGETIFPTCFFCHSKMHFKIQSYCI